MFLVNQVKKGEEHRTASPFFIFINRMFNII
jgi:hypothetical protein